MTSRPAPASTKTWGVTRAPKREDGLDRLLRGASLVIWTTTPWTIPANRAIAYGPEIAYLLMQVGAVDDTARQVGLDSATQQRVPSFFMQKPIACRHSWD